MISQANKRTLITGIALILLTNAIVFAGVAYNRSGEPESQLTLTERELRLPYRYQLNTENTGISLQLFYRVKGSTSRGVTYFMYSNNIDWLDKDKLETLGVDVSRSLDTDNDKYYYRKQVEKEVAFVMEYDGSAYQAALQMAEENLQRQQNNYEQNPDDQEAINKLNSAKDELRREKQAASRLFIIDAGLDQEILRNKYADQTKYVLLKGVIGVQVAAKDGSPYLTGYVKSVSNAHIHTPLSWHDVLEPLLINSNRNRVLDPPRYSVKLNIGKRLEPWVEEVKRLEN